jgi:recombinational DNA repair protein RecT
MTSDQSVSAEVARVQAPVDLVRANLEVFGRVLPGGISREMFGQWALSAMSKALADPKQAQAWERVLDPGNGAGLTSVMVALKDCAALGLRPGSEYHLVPFGATVTGITDYHGEIRLITNHEPCSVIARVVRENDKFAMLGANIPPQHEFAPFANRGPIIGGYSYVTYPDGRQSLVVYMPRSSDDPDANTFDKHQAVAKTQSIWTAWYEAMCLKTLVHAVRDFVPWSAERKW